MKSRSYTCFNFHITSWLLTHLVALMEKKTHLLRGHQRRPSRRSCHRTALWRARLTILVSKFQHGMEWFDSVSQFDQVKESSQNKSQKPNVRLVTVVTVVTSHCSLLVQHPVLSEWSREGGVFFFILWIRGIIGTIRHDQKSTKSHRSQAVLLQMLQVASPPVVLPRQILGEGKPSSLSTSLTHVIGDHATWGQNQSQSIFKF